MPSQSALRIEGGEKLAALGRELQMIGGPTARGLRSGVRRGIVSSARPLQREIQAAYRAVDVSDHSGSTGLRNALARSTKLRVLTSVRSAVVRIAVNHPLAAVWEGTKKWRHPLFGNTAHWYDEASHPTFYLTVRGKVAGVRAAVVAAVEETVRQLPPEI